MDNILPCLKLNELTKFSLVCKQFHQIVENEFTWKTVFQNQLSKDDPEDFQDLKKKGISFKEICKTKVASNKKLSKSKNKLLRRVDKKTKEQEKKKKKFERKKQSKLEKKEEKLQRKLHPELFVDKTPVYFYDGGSGMGIFQRSCDLEIEKISDSSRKVEKMNQPEIQTPFGFDSFALQIGKLSHLFKGPVTDPQGHNCWLNSILVFILSNPHLVNQIFNKKDEDALSTSLKDLFQYWIQHQHAKDFRKIFDHFYGRVWLNIQRLGFQYGHDYSVNVVFKELMKNLNISYENEDFVISYGLDESLKSQGFELKSWVNHEVIATTKQGHSLGHFTCYSKNEFGTFYFDDILQLNDDFQGGLIESFHGIGDSNFQLAFYSKSNVKHQLNNSSVSKVQSEVIPTKDEDSKCPFTGISKFNLDETLFKLHLIRFACEFDSLETLHEIESVQRIPGFSHHSEDKKKLMIRKELELICSSKHSVKGMTIACRIGLIDSIFKLDLEDKVNVDLMDCVKHLNEEPSLFQFLKEFQNVQVMKKVRRKYRKVSLCDEFLSQLLFSKKERKMLIQ
jgi:hypothetical protein